MPGKRPFCLVPCTALSEADTIEMEMRQSFSPKEGPIHEWYTHAGPSLRQRGGNMRNKGFFSMIIAIALLFTVACTTESERTESVTTTTDKGTTSAPAAKDAEKRDKALVRVVQALPDYERVDAYVGDAKEFPNVTYKSVTPYKEVPDNQEQFAIKPVGQDSAQPLAQNREGIRGGDHYTAIAMPATDGKPTLRVVGDNLTPPPAGKASVRVINASPGAGEVNVYLKDKENALFEGVNTQTATFYREVEPMTTTLEVRPQGKTDVLLTVPNVRLEPGHIYTFVIAGKGKGNLEVMKIDDRLAGAAGGPGSSPSPTGTISK
jgi:Domain of unknown function (DUF4397)